MIKEQPKTQATTQYAILEAAAQAFARKGYQATTIDDIAAAAGVARRSVYHHYKSKKAILQAACVVQAKAFLEEVRSCVSQDSDFPHYVRDCLLYVIERAPQSKLFMLDVGKSSELDPVAFYFGNNELIQDWIDFFQAPYVEALRKQQINPEIKLDKLVNWFGRICTSFLQYRLAGETTADIKESLDVFFLQALQNKNALQ